MYATQRGLGHLRISDAARYSAKRWKRGSWPPVVVASAASEMSGMPPSARMLGDGPWDAILLG